MVPCSLVSRRGVARRCSRAGEPRPASEPPARRVGYRAPPSSPTRAAAAATRSPPRARSGTAGPSLDALKPTAERVERQVTRGGRGMPAFGSRLTDEEIEAVAAYVAESAASRARCRSQRSSNRTTRRSPTARPTAACFEQAFGNLAFTEGPKRALEVFAENDRDRPHRSRLPSDRARGRRRRAGALRRGSRARHSRTARQCAGRATTTASSSAPTPVSPRKTCPPSRDACARASRCARPYFIAYQCVHGLGHGLMIYTDYELPLSLETCDAL